MCGPSGPSRSSALCQEICQQGLTGLTTTRPDRHDRLLANYWRRGQQGLLMQVTWLMTVIASQLKALRLLYFRALRSDGPRRHRDPH